MTPVEVLRLALEKETASIRLYKELAVEHAVLKDLLAELLIEEEKHKQRIEQKIYELTR